MSHRPVPTALRVLRGNPGKRPLPTREPHPPPLVDEAIPDELADDPDAAGAWTNLVAVLRNSRVLTEADRSALIALCQQWSIYLRAGRVFRKNMVIRTPHGGLVISPTERIQRNALTACHRLFVEFGLSPASRSKVQTSEAPDVGDKFSRFERVKRA